MLKATSFSLTSDYLKKAWIIKALLRRSVALLLTWLQKWSGRKVMVRPLIGTIWVLFCSRWFVEFLPFLLKPGSSGIIVDKKFKI